VTTRRGKAREGPEGRGKYFDAIFVSE